MITSITENSDNTNRRTLTDQDVSLFLDRIDEIYAAEHPYPESEKFLTALFSNKENIIRLINKGICSPRKLWDYTKNDFDIGPFKLVRKYWFKYLYKSPISLADLEAEIISPNTEKLKYSQQNSEDIIISSETNETNETEKDLADFITAFNNVAIEQDGRRIAEIESLRVELEYWGDDFPSKINNILSANLQYDFVPDDIDPDESTFDQTKYLCIDGVYIKQILQKNDQYQNDQ